MISHSTAMTHPHSCDNEAWTSVVTAAEMNKESKLINQNTTIVYTLVGNPTTFQMKKLNIFGF